MRNTWLGRVGGTCEGIEDLRCGAGHRRLAWDVDGDPKARSVLAVILEEVEDESVGRKGCTPVVPSEGGTLLEREGSS